MKPIHEPTTTRYASAITDARETDPVSTSPNSPASPHREEEPGGDHHLHAGGHQRPVRQHRVALVDRARRPARGRGEREDQPAHVDLALERVPAHEQRRPDEPHREPDHTTLGWRCPRTTRSISAIHSGTVAIASPAIPDGIVRSAQTMPPLPPNIISAATTAAAPNGSHADGRPTGPRTGARSAAAPARDQEPDPTTEQRRDRLVRHPDRDERRAPRHVDQRERRPDRRGRTAPPSGRLLDRSGHADHDTGRPAQVSLAFRCLSVTSHEPPPSSVLRLADLPGARGRGSVA